MNNELPVNAILDAKDIELYPEIVSSLFFSININKIALINSDASCRECMLKISIILSIAYLSRF